MTGVLIKKKRRLEVESRDAKMIQHTQINKYDISHQNNEG
jgi:hypothetical protein